MNRCIRYVNLIKRGSLKTTNKILGIKSGQFIDVDTYVNLILKLGLRDVGCVIMDTAWNWPWKVSCMALASIL